MPPVVAVIGAVAGAVGTGVAAVGAAVGAAGVMTSLAYVGTAMTVAGAVTGNKKLSKWGSVIGLVGGAGAAGLFGNAAKNATFNSALGRTAANTVGKNVATNAASSLAFSPAQTPTLLPGAGVKAVGQGGGLLSSQMPSTIMGTNIPIPVGQVAKTGAWNAVKSGASNLVQAAKDNPELTKILADSAAGVADYLSGVPDAEIAALESQVRGNDAQSEKLRFDLENEKRRRANLNAGYMQVNSALAAPNPATAAGNPFASGLIAGARA